MIMSIMGVPAPTGFLVLNAGDIHIARGEGSIEIWSDPPQPPGLYCGACASKLSKP